MLRAGRDVALREVGMTTSIQEGAPFLGAMNTWVGSVLSQLAALCEKQSQRGRGHKARTLRLAQATMQVATLALLVLQPGVAARRSSKTGQP
jgi:hypothetical protein